MRKLWVLYDEHCGLCCELKKWAARQPAYVPLEFLASGSAEAIRLFPSFASGDKPPEEMIVISDEGGVYRDGAAYIMCLYALRDFREWSFRFSTPALFPYARRFFLFLSSHRSSLSRLLRLTSDAELAQMIQTQPGSACEVKRPPRNSQGIVCPFCKDSLSDRQLVHCSRCGSAHHRDCWITNRYNCSVFGCQPQLTLRA